MILKVNGITVETKIKYTTVRGANSIKINGNYILKKNDNIIFKCCICNKEKNQKFRFKPKFIEDDIICDSCNRSINNPFKRNDVKEKIKNTNLKRYNVKNSMQNKEILKKAQQKQKDNNNGVLAFNSDKQKKTLKKKYGNEVIFKTQHFKEKTKKTLLKNYGVENPMKSDIIKNKTKSTMKKRYGNEIIYKSIYFKKKSKKTIQERYGVDYIIQNPEIKEKIENTMITRYGSKTFLTSNRYIAMGINTNTSKTHYEIISFIKSFNITNIKINNRKIISPMELDIYLPDHNIAIEFDGLYWHSDKFKEKNYHINKTLQCEAKNIHLIHIFEDEWANKRGIIEARLKNLLGLNSKRIGARKTIIKEISPKVKNAFLEKHHIQGEDKSNIKLGAYYRNELIGVMTFSKPRIFMSKKAKDGSWELSRFATIPDTYTPGLASKMLKYFERGWNPKLIESFADRRWSQGNLYKKLGFELASQTNPNYYYFKNLKRWHRYKFRKSELTKFDNYTPEKTEKEIMNEAGWGRIYDCGNYKFTKDYF